MFKTVAYIRSVVNRDKKDNAYSRLFYRHLSPFLTYLFLRLGISANTTTWLSVIIALLGCFLISFSNALATLIGLACIQLWYLLDHVDGEIARITKTASPEGIYLDIMTHIIVHPIIYFSFGLDAVHYLPQTYSLPFIPFVMPLRRVLLLVSFIAGLSALIIDLSSALRYQILIGNSTKRRTTARYTDIVIRFQNAHPVGKANRLFRLWHIVWLVFCIPGSIWFLTVGSLLRINAFVLPVYALVLAPLAIVSIVVRLRSKIDTLY